MEINKIIILGGVVIDIISKTSNNEILNNSNIGEIDLKIGGSGRNCAECIARLGYSKDILLISAIGKDDTLKNEMINQQLKNVGLKNKGLIKIINQKTATFNAVLDSKGDYLIGVADMNVFNFLSIQDIQFVDFQHSDVIVIDSNFNGDFINYILQQCQNVNHVIFEPISLEKQLKLIHLIPMFTTYKGNIQQFNQLVQYQDNQQQDISILEKARKYLMSLDKNTRLQIMIITDGKNGFYYIEKQGFEYKFDNLKEKQIEVINSIGAGDCFLGGYIAGIMNQDSIFKKLQLAHKCATLTIQSQFNVSQEINPSLF